MGRLHPVGTCWPTGVSSQAIFLRLHKGWTMVTWGTCSVGLALGSTGVIAETLNLPLPHHLLWELDLGKTGSNFTSTVLKYRGFLANCFSRMHEEGHGRNSVFRSSLSLKLGPSAWTWQAWSLPFSWEAEKAQRKTLPYRGRLPGQAPPALCPGGLLAV